MSNNGEKTGVLGAELKAILEGGTSSQDTGLKVHYDHERKKNREGKWFRAVAYMDELGHPDRATSLSYVDLIVVKGKTALVICEMEESGADPKTIIGDVYNLLIADGIRHSDSEYTIEDAHIVLGFTAKEGGRGEEKATLIRDRLLKAFEAGYRRRLSIEVICRPGADELKDVTRGHILSYLRSKGHLLQR